MQWLNFIVDFIILNQRLVCTSVCLLPCSLSKIFEFFIFIFSICLKKVECDIKLYINIGTKKSNNKKIFDIIFVNV